MLNGCHPARNQDSGQPDQPCPSPATAALPIVAAGKPKVGDGRPRHSDQNDASMQ